MKNEIVYITTYGEYSEDNLKNEDELIEETITFGVNKNWLAEKVKEIYNMSLEEFLNWYTYDTSLCLYHLWQEKVS